MIRQSDGIRPDVKLPLALAQDAAEDGARMHADAHVDVDFERLANFPTQKDDFFLSLAIIIIIISLNRLNHSETHFDAISRVIRIRLGQAGNAVVAVAEQLDTKTLVFLKEKYRKSIRRIIDPVARANLGQFVESRKEFIEHLDELLCRRIAR